MNRNLQIVQVKSGNLLITIVATFEKFITSLVVIWGDSW